MDVRSIVFSALRDQKITQRELNRILRAASEEDTELLTGLYQGNASFASPKLKAQLGDYLKTQNTALQGLQPALSGFSLRVGRAAVLCSSADGVLSGDELASAHKTLSERFGDEAASRILLRSIGVRAETITADGAQWLKDNYEPMAGHLDGIEALLIAYGAGQRVLDANENNVIDAGDIGLGANDENAEVFALDALLADRVRVAAAMVEAAYEMDAAGHPFELARTHAFSETFWQIEKEGHGVFALKEGVRPSDAMNDIFENPYDYGFECATALVIVYYRAVQRALGDEDFDRVFTKMRIGPWSYDRKLRRALFQRTPLSRYKAAPDHFDNTLPGDYAYIRNWDVSPESKKMGWQGENLIVLPNGLVYGHPFGISTVDTVIDYLNMHRNPGSTESASFQQVEQRLRPSVLEHDLLAEPPTRPRLSP